MNNNDILKRLRYMFDFSDAQMMALFALNGYEATRAEVSNWLKKEEDEEFLQLSDLMLGVFLNGLILQNRGSKEGVILKAEAELSNNEILKKLKVALQLTSDDILAIFASTGKKLTATELSAFLRNESQSQYRPFQDQYLRNFIRGLQLKYRP